MGQSLTKSLNYICFVFITVVNRFNDISIHELVKQLYGILIDPDVKTVLIFSSKKVNKFGRNFTLGGVLKVGDISVGLLTLVWYTNTEKMHSNHN